MSRKALSVFDEVKLIDNMLSQAPRGMMLRELIVNGLEAKRDPLEGSERRIRLYMDENKKLIIFNTGQGMDASELYNCADLAYTGAHKGDHTGRVNRGEGAKVASLRFNTQGMRYRSRKDGKISQVLLSHSDEHGWSVEAEAVVLTESDKTRYFSVAGDFTEVTLLGMSSEHCTGYTPYDDQCEVKANDVLSEIFQRFYAFEEPSGLKTDFMVSEDYRPGAQGQLTFQTMGQILSTTQNKLEHPLDRFVEIADGARIEYVKYAGSTNSKRSPLHSSRALGRNTMAAIVWKGEMYAAIVGQDWGRKAAGYGLMGMGQDVTVLVHLPDDYAVEEDRYRKFLMKNGELLQLEYFNQDIITSRPQWLLDLIDSQNRKKRADRSLESRLAAFAIKQFRFDPKSPNNVYLLNGGKPKRERKPVVNPRGKRGPNVNQDNGDNQGKTIGKIPARLPGSADTSSNPSVPSCLWITNADIDAYPMMRDTAVAYVPNDYSFIINEDSPIIQQLKSEIKDGLDRKSLSVSNAALDFAILDTLKDYAGFRVGQYILSVQALANGASWDGNKMARAYSDEALEAILYSTNSESERMCGDIVRRHDVKAGALIALPAA